MGLNKLIAPFPWSGYSKKLAEKIECPHNAGWFDFEASEARGMRLATGASGGLNDGNHVRLFLLIDKNDGAIVDAKFQVMGQSALIGAAEIACDLLVKMDYEQAKRLSSELIDKKARDRSGVPAFPVETAPLLNLILEAIEDAADQCSDIPLSASYTAPPAFAQVGAVLEGGYPGWENLSKKEKLHVIEGVLESEIRPYIALDGGGVEVLDLSSANELLIGYQGNCTSCFSAIGATLSYIQSVIQAKVHPDLTVVPDFPET